MTSDGAALGLAQARINRYADPRLQIRSVTIRPQVQPDVLFPAVLSAELGDSVAVDWPRAGIMDNYRIEGMQIRVESNAHGAPVWTVDWRLANVLRTPKNSGRSGLSASPS